MGVEVAHQAIRQATISVVSNDYLVTVQYQQHLVVRFVMLIV